MASSAKKRPKSKPCDSSSISRASLKSSFLWEPPDDLFPSKDELFRLFAGMAVAVSLFLSFNFFANSFTNRQPKLSFCDSTRDELLSYDCEPCPSYGQCNEGKLECDHGYMKHGNVCVEDGDINQTAKKLSDWVQHRLCESYAQYMCGGSGIIWENDIWNGLDDSKLIKHIGSNGAVNNYTKHRAVESIDKVLETQRNSIGEKQLKCPDGLAESYKPSSCRVRQWISNNLLLIMPICILLMGFAYLIWTVRKRLYLLKRVEELYQQVCEVLEESALGTGECESWVVASKLRDHLLSPKERKNPTLWKKVEELVQEDSRVDRYPKLVKGEAKVVWEWQVEGCLSSSRKRNKGEASTVKLTETANLNSNRNHHRQKSERGAGFLKWGNFLTKNSPV